MAEEYPRYGYKKLTVLLISLFGIKINRKKVYRLCKEMNLLLSVYRKTLSTRAILDSFQKSCSK
ncbi:transposase [Thermoanaerobacterium thermosaccharolyticum]|uniref:transposase n=1 Tax=Thermoanaerobacterium thermosaccharolyticum TaxID=1517 RepID=UPI003D288FE7